MNSLISICIPTYNGAAYIAEAMKSAICQTYSNCEIIISDDASTDNTLQIVETFRDKSPFPIRIFNHKPNGIGANWNNCVKKSNGEYIKFLFQDDVLDATCVQEMLKVFKIAPNIGLVASKRRIIIEQNTKEIEDWLSKYKNLQVQFEKGDTTTRINYKLFKEDFFLKKPFNKIGEPSVTMFKKSIIDKINLFDEELKQILDYVFYYRLLKKFDIIIINKPLVSFRIHEAQATNVNRNQSIKDYSLYDEILHKEFYRLLNKSHRKRLFNKFSLVARINNKIKSVIRKLFK